MPFSLIVIGIVAAVAVLLAYMVIILGRPLLKLMSSGGALPVARGVSLGVVLLGELAIVVTLAVVVARL